ncbi:MAG: CvpA family protein [Planctomycetia bacterium]|nr:CvpA family protein [Planctomycetia bacterium]
MFGLELYDLFILLFLAVMTVRGGMNGIVAQVLSIVSLLVAWLLSVNCYGIVGGLFPSEVSWNKPVAMLVVFIGAMIGLKIGSRIVRGAVRKTVLREFDRQLGALLGGLKGFVICLVITFFCVTMSEATRNAVASSRTGKYFVSAINMCAGVIPDDIEHSVLREQLAKFKENTENSGLAATEHSLREDIDELKEKLTGDVLSAESTAVVESSRKEAEAKRVASSYETLASSFEEFVNQWHTPQQLAEQTTPDPTAYSTDLTAVTSNYPVGQSSSTTNGAQNQTMTFSLPLPDLGSQLQVNVPVPDTQTVSRVVSQVVTQAVSDYTNRGSVSVANSSPTQNANRTRSTPPAPAVSTSAPIAPVAPAPVSPAPFSSYNTGSYYTPGSTVIPSYNNLVTPPNAVPVLSGDHTFAPTQTAPGLR